MSDGDGIDDAGLDDPEDGSGPVTAPWSPYAGGHPFAATGSGELHGTKNAADAGRPGDHHDDHHDGHDGHDGKHLAAAHEDVTDKLSVAAQGAGVPVTEHASAGHLVEAVIDHLGKHAVPSVTVAVPPGQEQVVAPLREHLPPDVPVVVTSPDPGTAVRAADALGRADQVLEATFLGDAVRVFGESVTDVAHTLGVSTMFAVHPLVGLATVGLVCGGLDTKAATHHDAKTFFDLHVTATAIHESGDDGQEAFDTWSHCHIACEGARRCGPLVVLGAGAFYEGVHEAEHQFRADHHPSLYSDLEAQNTGVRLRFDDADCRTACMREMNEGRLRYWHRDAQP